MDELLDWLLGVLTVALVAIGIRQEAMFSSLRKLRSEDLSRIASNVDRVRVMHEHPDDYGFGVRETNRLLKTIVQEQAQVLSSQSQSTAAQIEVTRALRDLVHYIVAEHEERTGKKMKPIPPGTGVA
jgi:predicted SPOUT superfamily RNA methylase MTH1